MKNKPSIKLAQLICIKDLVAHGRNESGEPDVCFVQDKNYLFCYDPVRGEIFTLNEVGHIHFFDADDSYTREHFNLIEIANIGRFDLDEVTTHRYERMFKARHNYSEEF